MKMLFRMIIPAFPRVNIFSHQAKRTTALGPLMVATVANKLPGWTVEVIDENNYKGGVPNHKKLQKDRPAMVVGFYCGLTSTMKRVWDLAKFYHDKGAFVVAGGWHAHYCPEETLNHHIDVVVHGDGEEAIVQLLNAFSQSEIMSKVGTIPGISFFRNGEFSQNGPKRREVVDLDDLPFPDFGLLRKANLKVYPIGRIRGCNQGCEFCSVKGTPRWAGAEHLFETVVHLIETRKAKRFFIVDDRLEGDPEGTKKFFELVAEKYGAILRFTVQVRLDLAENAELMEIMRSAGVRIVCVGVESPIDEDLQSMRKGYSSEKMIDWIKVLRGYFWVHSMFIVGYPSRVLGAKLSSSEIVRRFRKFVCKSGSDSIQVMLPGPGVGTGLRRRLEKADRLFPLEVVGWDKYDGGYVCFRPDNMDVRSLQEIPLKIMSRFYNFGNFLKIPFRTIALPGYYFLRGWSDWLRRWSQDLTRAGGHLLVQRRKEQEGAENHVVRIENYLKSK